MLLHARPDLKVVGLRGNVDTRLKRASDGSLDAIVLASAGLRRLCLDQHVTQWLTAPGFLPAVGQGALGIECRAEDTETQSSLAVLNHEPTRQAVLAERECLNALGGGCLIPLGAYARVATDGMLRLVAAVLDPDGKERLDAESEGSVKEPLTLGRRVAELLKDQGADRILALVRSGESS
jgi:hydroxymethylbilane synthase